MASVTQFVALSYIAKWSSKVFFLCLQFVLTIQNIKSTMNVTRCLGGWRDFLSLHFTPFSFFFSLFCKANVCWLVWCRVLLFLFSWGFDWKDTEGLRLHRNFFYNIYRAFVLLTEKKTATKMFSSSQKQQFSTDHLFSIFIVVFLLRSRGFEVRNICELISKIVLV